MREVSPSLPTAWSLEAVLILQLVNIIWAAEKNTYFKTRTLGTESFKG